MSKYGNTSTNSENVRQPIDYLSTPPLVGYVLTAIDTNGNFDWAPSGGGGGGTSIMSPDDKFLTAAATFVDGDVACTTGITNTPIDGCYVAVFINGIEYEVGNGVDTTTCYFGDGMSPNLPRGFSSSHPNGQVQAGDKLYWNGSNIGFEIKVGWRVTFHYLV